MRGIGDYDEAAGAGVNERLDLDIGLDSHFDGTSDDYYTPAFIFEALNVNFDIDVCAPPGGISWIPATKSYSVIDDGLVQDWGGATVWMNPPYSDPKLWAEKFVLNANGIALMPTSQGAWMLTLWQSDTHWLMMPPVKFVKSNGETSKAALPNRCWLIGTGADNVEAMRQSNLGFVR